MKKHIELIKSDTYYHIYNRGINGEPIFKSDINYSYFLRQYAKYIESVADTYAYCLLNNHFHLLIKTKSENDILTNIKAIKKLENWIPESKIPKSSSFYISDQFAKLFNSYAQAINKTEDRTGSLFETPFRRIEVSSDAYFSQLVYYIHNNPQKHGFILDFRKYPYSSYNSHLVLSKTKLKREEVLEWFGNKEQYEMFHRMNHDENQINDLIIEFGS
jgi:putative transposase